MSGPAASPRVASAFPKSHRLLKRRDFVTAQQASVAVRLPFAVLLLHQRQLAGPLRLGVVASRRVGGAVVRNRAKRLIREWFRHLDSPLTGCDVVVVVRASARGWTAVAMADALTGGLRQGAKRLSRRRAER